MFLALAAGAFLALWIWMRQRAGAVKRDMERLNTQLRDTQSQVEKAEHKAQHLVGLLTELHEYKVGPTGKADLIDLADFTVQTTSSLLGMGRVVLLHWDPLAAVYKGLAARGMAPQQLADLKVRRGEGALGKAAQGGKVLLVNEPGTSTPTAEENFLVAPYLVLPLWVNSQVNGLLVLAKPQQPRIGPESMRLATLMAKHIQLTLENVDLYESRQHVFGEVVGALTAALGVKDIESHAHTDHCRTLIRAMAGHMKLPSSLIEQFEFGAMLHDIGKLGIEETLLMKPGPLTDEEYAVVKKHPEIGFKLLRDISFLKGVAPIVLYHHEWVNGQGYPEGLAGEEIPLGARMLAIVDAWDAMTHDQPYRQALQKNNAIAELRQQAGTQFDPKLVDVFLHMMDRLERAAAKTASS